MKLNYSNLNYAKADLLYININYAKADLLTANLKPLTFYYKCKSIACKFGLDQQRLLSLLAM